MRADKLIVPGMHILTIDTQAGFVKPGGAFENTYGKEDIEPLARVCGEIERMIRRMREYAETTLVLSDYPYNTFGVPGLENLCVTPESRTPVIPPELFSRIIIKNQNSVFSSDADLQELFGDVSRLLIAGLTTTHCIIQTIRDFREHMPDLTIVVAENTVATRKSREADGQRILAQLADESERGVVVVGSWNDIIIDKIS